ncbi:unnamed protein product [Rhizopus stolonifer]
MDYFLSPEFNVAQAIACDETAPTTGEKHVHIYLIFKEKIDNKNAREFFKYKDLCLNISPGTNKEGTILYCVKGGDYITHNLNVNYEIRTKKLHKQYVAYELINGLASLTEANSYLSDLSHEENKGKTLLEWQMFGIQTWFSGQGRTPQYWIVGPTNVGKTYNVDQIELKSHRPYLMSKDNDWSDYSDDNYDFMYNEETGADFKLTFLNQLLEGTRLKLNGKYVKTSIKKKNMLIILNSNYMPHMVYKNTGLYALEPTLNRLYIIYVDRNRKGHIIWNPDVMTINDYANLFVNNPIGMESYDSLFENELSTDKSYIKYVKTCDEHINVIPFQEITPDMLEKSPRENKFFKDLPFEPKEIYIPYTDSNESTIYNGYSLLTISPQLLIMYNGRFYILCITN